MAKLDSDTLKAAIVGYQHEYDQLSAKIEDLRRQLRGRAVAAPASAPAGKRSLSDAARERIAAAQKARWDAYHASRGTAKKTGRGKAAGKRARKRNLSPEGRARIIAALKKRWAAAKKQPAA